MYCKKYGTQIPEGANSCPNCDMVVGQVPRNQQRFSGVDSSHDVTPTSIPSEISTNTSDEAHTNRPAILASENRWKLVFLICQGLILLFVILLVIWFVVLRSDDSDDNNNRNGVMMVETTNEVTMEALETLGSVTNETTTTEVTTKNTVSTTNTTTAVPQQLGTAGTTKATTKAYTTTKKKSTTTTAKSKSLKTTTMTKKTTTTIETTTTTGIEQAYINPFDIIYCFSVSASSSREADSDSQGSAYAYDDYDTDSSSDGEIYTYSTGNLLDGSISTCWASSGSGKGDSIYLEAGGEIVIDSIEIDNGNQRSEVAFLESNRPKTITLEFSDGSATTATLEDGYQSTTEIVLDKNICTSYIKITIESVYSGDSGENASISEITVNGWDV